MKKKKFEQGDAYAVPLKSGGYAIGVCCGSDFAFFDFRTDAPSLPDEIFAFPLAFRVPVAKDAVSEGDWDYLGNVGLPGAYALPAKYLHKPIGSEQYFIYSDGAETPAGEDECRGLEVLATWFSFHIQDRLEDFFAGRENAYVAAIKKQLGIRERS